MFHLYFIRHGKTDWNEQQKLQGQQDIPLNALGRRQAQAVAERLQREAFDVLYTSDLSRAYETASAINVHHGLTIVKDPRLRERSFGCFEGFTVEQSRRRYPDLRAAYERDKLNFRIPGGESRLEFIFRVGDFFEALRRQHSDQTVVVVAHGGVMGSIVSHVISRKLGFDPPRFVPLFSVENCSISQLRYHGEQWLLQSLNQTDHLAHLPVGEYAQRRTT